MKKRKLNPRVNRVREFLRSYGRKLALSGNSAPFLLDKMLFTSLDSTLQQFHFIFLEKIGPKTKTASLRQHSQFVIPSGQIFCSYYSQRTKKCPSKNSVCSTLCILQWHKVVHVIEHKIHCTAKEIVFYPCQNFK